MRPDRRALLPLLLAALLAWAAPARGEFVPDPKKLPRPAGYVSDYAGMLASEDVQQLEALLAELDQKTTVQVAVVTVPSLGDYDAQQFAVGIFENWKPGTKGRDNGAVFLVAPNERRLFINTGYGLEECLPDARVSDVVALVRGYFRQGQMGPGVLAGARALAARIAECAQVQLSGSPEVAPHRAGGRGRRMSPLEAIILLTIFLPIVIVMSVLNSLGRLGGGRRFRGGGWYGGGMGGFGGGGFGGGGFGGFGGGATGGGGAGGSW